jgi:outer membrane protein TolC
MRLSFYSFMNKINNTFLSSFLFSGKFRRLWVIFFCGFSLPGYAQLLLTMDKAMDIAQENSPAIQTSLMNLERYQQSLIAQRASLKSKFTLNLNPVNYNRSRSFDNRLSQWYTNETFTTGGTFQINQPILWTDGVVSLTNQFGWQDNNSMVEGFKNSNQAFSNNLYLQISQPLFTYNTRKMELKRIEYNLENAQISYALQQLNTERQITNQFYSVYMSQSNLEISKEELINAQQSYDIIKNKVEADLAAKDELFQAELNLATARSSVEERLVSLENQKDLLKQTLGVELEEDLIVVSEIEIDSIDIDREEAIAHGLNSRLELRQREIESKEQEFELIRTKALNEFKGDVSLSLGLTGDNRDFNKIYDNPTRNPRVMLSFSVPLFDWGEKKARVRAQEMAMRINETNYQDDKVKIELEIRQVCRSLQNLKTQIKIAEQNVRNAQLTYDLNLTRYREGDITGMSIDQFQTQLSNKKIAYKQALINYKIELLNLKILSLYDFEKKAAIVPLKDFIQKKE